VKPQRALLEPAEDLGAGALPVLRASEAAHREDLVREHLTGEKLASAEDQDVVLAPVTLVVDHELAVHAAIGWRIRGRVVEVEEGGLGLLPQRLACDGVSQKA